MAALLSTAVSRTAVVAAVRHLVRAPAEHRVAFMPPNEAGLSQLFRARPRIVIADATQLGLSFEPVLSIRRHLADACLVALVGAGTDAVRDTIALMQAGVDSVYPTDHGRLDPHILASTIDRAVAEATVGSVLSEWRGPSRPTLRLFVQRLWLRCGRPVSVSEAAMLYHSDPSTLQRHLRAAVFFRMSRSMST